MPKSDLEYARAQLDAFEAAVKQEELEEAKKKKKPYDSITVHTGCTSYNIDQFNKRMGTAFPGNDNSNPSTEEAKAAAKAAEDAAAEANASVAEGAGDESSASSGPATGGEASGGDAGAGTSAGGEGGGMGESFQVAIKEALEEAKLFIPKLARASGNGDPDINRATIDIPDKIQIVDTARVEQAIEQLSPEQPFTVGYVTPVYFYDDLWDKFMLIKCTTFTGYTGMDYRDVRATDEHGAEYAGHTDRLAKSQGQIDNPFDDENRRVKRIDSQTPKEYAQVNKLVNQGDIIYHDNETNQVEHRIENHTILYYPDFTKAPKVVYFLDLHNGKGYFKVSRNVLEQTIIDYVEGLLIDPAFAKSNRWDTARLRAKIQKTLDTDYATQADQVLKSKNVWEPTATDQTANRVNKPQVRALYTGQIFYIDTPYVSYGAPLRESLGFNLDEELWPKDHAVVEDRFEEKEVMKAKVKDWLAAEKPCEFQIEDVPADLTWEEVIEAYKEGKEPRGGLHLDTEPREYIWQRAGELYYLQTGEFLDKDFERIYNEKRTDLQTPEEKVEGEEMLMATKPGVPEDGEEVAVEEAPVEEALVTEAKRETRRYYIRPQGIFCANKAEVIRALISIGDENCSVYTLKGLGDNRDVHKLTNKDIIYYYDDGILYDKNHVKVMDYDLYIKHEEERKKFPGDVDNVSGAAFIDAYDDRITDITGPGLEDQVKEELTENSAEEDPFDQDFENYGDNEKEAPMAEKFVKLFDSAYKNEYYNMFDLKQLMKSCQKTLENHTIERINLIVKFDNHCKVIQETADGCLVSVPVYFRNPENRSQILDTPEYWEVWAPKKDCIVESLTEGADSHYTCCICGEECVGYGNNPYPVKEEGKCCDACNLKFVIPARMRATINDWNPDED